jgi:predicted ATPase
MSLAHLERNPAKVDRLASDLIELSTRHNFVHWLAIGAISHGWARSASGNTTAEGIPRIEQGIRDLRATGTVLDLTAFLVFKAEALHLADRTSEALEAINEAVAIAKKFEHGYCSAELHRLRGVFFAALGAERVRIEASFCDAVRIAKEQKSVSLEERAKATYAEYRRRKAGGMRRPGTRLPLCHACGLRFCIILPTPFLRIPFHLALARTSLPNAFSRWVIMEPTSPV